MVVDLEAVVELLLVVVVGCEVVIWNGLAYCLLVSHVSSEIQRVVWVLTVLIYCVALAWEQLLGAVFFQPLWLA